MTVCTTDCSTYNKHKVQNIYRPTKSTLQIMKEYKPSLNQGNHKVELHNVACLFK